MQGILKNPARALDSRLRGNDGWWSYPVDDLLAEQALRPHEEEQEGQDVGEPDLDTAADQRADVDLGELSPTAHREAETAKAHRG